MPVIDPSVLQTIVSGDKNLKALSCTHSSSLHYSSSEEQDLYENKLRPGNIDRRSSQDIQLSTSRVMKEKTKICSWLKKEEMSTTQDDHKENFEKFDEIKIDSSDTNKDIPEKEIKSCNLVKDFKTYKSFKTEKSESFGEVFRDLKSVNNIKENAEKKDDILEEKVTENILAIPKSSKKEGLYYSSAELYSLREHDLSKAPPKGKINWDVMVLLLPEVCLQESLV